MHHLVAAARQAVAQGNWYAALALALTFPDIAGKLRTPDAKTQQRAVDWWDEWIGPAYTTYNSAANEWRLFLRGADAYGLRCAVLHEGADSAREHWSRVISKFEFTMPPSDGGMMHMNSIDGRLQLQVDIFVMDICDGVERWMLASRTDKELESRIRGLMMIDPAPD